MARARAITGLDSQVPPAQNARVIVRARLADLYMYADAVGDPANIRALHDLRIAAKRLRYTLEMFARHLPTASQAVADELAALQDELGALHDSEVLLSLLRLSLQIGASHAPGQDLGATLTPQEQSLLNQEMLARVLDITYDPAPSERERRGLEHFLQRQEQRREQAYEAFRQHWDQLERRDLRAEIETLLVEETH